MSEYSFHKMDHERGTALDFRSGSLQVILFAPRSVTNHRIIGEPYQQVLAGWAQAGETLNEKAPDLSPSGFAKSARELVSSRLSAPFQNAVRSVPAAHADLNGRWSDFKRARFSDDVPPTVRVERRQWARGLKLPDLMKAAQADPMLVASIIEGGLAMSGLPADIFDQLSREFAIGNAARILSGQNQYRTAPSANDPVGGTVDHAAARAAGEALIGALEAEGEVLAEAPATLANAVNAVAIMTDTTRDDAYQLLAA